LALSLLPDGTATRDSFSIADELDALGAQISTSTSPDLSIVRLAAVPMHLGRSLDLYADVIRNPVFPDDQLTQARGRRLAAIAQEKATPTALAQRIASRLLYGDAHAYGTPPSGTGTEAAVSALTRADLAAWHRAWFHPGNSTLVVTGDITMARLLPELERAFGSWPAGEAPAKQLGDVRAAERGRVYVIDRPDAPQSVIVAAHVSRPAGQPDDL